MTKKKAKNFRKGREQSRARYNEARRQRFTKVDGGLSAEPTPTWTLDNESDTSAPRSAEYDAGKAL